MERLGRLVGHMLSRILTLALPSLSDPWLCVGMSLLGRL
ncbi:hypothetical protein SAMN05444169_7621 [Bradyrhizobium erythrophlei]|uniref:Uncharacterized protein n=1 Tax=Bradyrhizobium erythrophlei TaxID=1437360 RepID=A0A1M5T8T0_9BRAD|nr:hypothetical protein SAMN05444169_7621 [Bradyrhizobium erythrophlei]